ncbi:hypothetical protein FPQ18DRAFT_392715 [Pyronema domesticum]|uniref:Uncharacterized protein n=1 Tax=Pyronema omphalodes (strain CBS 100304) TaxID=1076935 RepID=U4LH41_PYROM|nr:hypothetical protein FPQ18DRAFT_392715 [Pyronema domesticum]CCX15734.1 Protein of unknown function [Pyronema omphalodes CBS 100304]
MKLTILLAIPPILAAATAIANPEASPKEWPKKVGASKCANFNEDCKDIPCCNSPAFGCYKYEGPPAWRCHRFT